MKVCYKLPQTFMQHAFAKCPFSAVWGREKQVETPEVVQPLPGDALCPVSLSKALSTFPQCFPVTSTPLSPPGDETE